MSVVIFSDIDDTLIQSKRKCSPADSLLVGALDRQGEPLSFMRSQQQKLISIFSQHEFIPVTGRNKHSLDRVQVDFTSHKIINHGAIVLNAEDKIPEAWHCTLVEQSLSWTSILKEYYEEVDECITEKNLDLRSKIVTDYGFSCYVSIKGCRDSMQELDYITKRFDDIEPMARVHKNDRDMALLPPYACKKRAVEFLKKYYLQQDSTTLFLSIGDSCTDLPYMDSCHFKMIPTLSQIDCEKLHDTPS